MGFILRTGSTLAVATLAGATFLATPPASPERGAGAIGSPSVMLAAAATESEVTTPDRIDQSFLDFRTGVRAEFNAFANELGYLGKQMYIGFNFGESVLASAVFNGTDILRGEGLFTNLNEFAVDVALAAAWIVADELYLHIEDLPPIEILLNRPPRDPAPGWTRPQPPDPLRPLVPDTAQAAAPTTADEEEASLADRIDRSFIDSRVDVRTDFHAFANQLGYLGKQIYIGFNFVESLVASAVFNGTDMLRGEGVLKNLGEIASDVVSAGLWIAADELYLHVPELPPIDPLPNRAPQDRPLEWVRPLPPRADRDLALPVWERPESSVTEASVDESDSGTIDLTDSDDTEREAVAEAEVEVEAEVRSDESASETDSEPEADSNDPASQKPAEPSRPSVAE